MTKVELATEIVRLDERLKALQREIEQNLITGQRALELKATELDRRMEILNGEAGRIASERGQFVRVERFDSLSEKVEQVKQDASNARGRMWLQQIVFAAAASALTYAVVAKLFNK